MKKIDTLIRLHKFELDEKRRALKALEANMARLMDARAMLDQELIAEQETAAKGVELGVTYHSYSRNFIARRERMEHDIAELKVEIEKAEIIMQMAYQELKKYEITAARIAEQEKLAAKQKEQSEMDEAGIQSHVRKNKK